MEKVAFTFKNGRERMMSVRDADLLTKLNKGTYLTRDMAHQPGVVVVEKAEPVVESVPQTEEAPRETTEDMDDLDAMDKDHLHALAKERGVNVHHNAGVDKVRAALREAKAE